MTDHELLEDPSGAPYPESVQRLARAIDLAELGPYVLDSGREALVHALEAAIAADREHRPPAPELDEETHRKLFDLYLSGMVAGSATTLLQGGTADEVCQNVAMALVGRFVEDPGSRYDLLELVAGFWTKGMPEEPLWQRFNAYPTPPRDND